MEINNPKKTLLFSQVNAVRLCMSKLWLQLIHHNVQEKRKNADGHITGHDQRVEVGLLVLVGRAAEPLPFFCRIAGFGAEVSCQSHVVSVGGRGKNTDASADSGIMTLQCSWPSLKVERIKKLA